MFFKIDNKQDSIFQTVYDNILLSMQYIQYKHIKIVVSLKYVKGLVDSSTDPQI